MDRFTLPHSHGERHAENMYKEISNIERFASLADIFKQLSDATRLRIFWLLSHNEECVINIAAMLDMSSPAVSHHLRSMCEAGLLISSRDGKEVYYRIADTELSKTLHDGIESIWSMECPQKNAWSEDSTEDTVRLVHDYLSEHISDRITIDYLAKRFLINPTTLKREFKKIYGNSIAAHTKEHRMELACKMLSEGKASISDIAAAVGYDSQSKFTDAFKRAYGMLPTEYRKNKVKILLIEGK